MRFFIRQWAGGLVSLEAGENGLDDLLTFLPCLGISNSRKS